MAQEDDDLWKIWETEVMWVEEEIIQPGMDISEAYFLIYRVCYTDKKVPGPRRVDLAASSP